MHTQLTKLQTVTISRRITRDLFHHHRPLLRLVPAARTFSSALLIKNRATTTANTTRIPPAQLQTRNMASATSFYDFKPLDSMSLHSTLAMLVNSIQPTNMPPSYPANPTPQRISITKHSTLPFHTAIPNPSLTRPQQRKATRSPFQPTQAKSS